MNNWFFHVVSYPHLIIHNYKEKIKCCSSKRGNVAIQI